MNDLGDGFVSRSDGQTFFIGPTFFLRPVEPDDARSAPIWHPNRFPAPVELMRKRIEAELGSDLDREAGQQRLLICRKSDDRPVGSVLFTYENERACFLRFQHDPKRSLDERARIEIEIMQFTIPFLIERRHFMKVTTDHLGDHPSIRETAELLGMRQCYRLREASLYENQRYDRIGYERVNPLWIGLLGMPRGMTEGPASRIMPPRSRLQPNSEYVPPLATIITGERLELRAFEPEDGALASYWALRETGDFFPQGPPVHNPWVYGQHMAAITRQEQPSEIRLAIVESQTQQVIGITGIAQLDLIEGRGKTTTTIYQPTSRNRGYGVEAKELMFQYLFDRLGLHMVYAWVSESNQRSIAALRKLGYREAGYFAWDDLSGAGYAGGFYFDLLASEWRATR